MTQSSAAGSWLLAPFGERTRALFQLIGYTPTPAQLPVLLSTANQVIVTGGIHSGKSVLGAKKVVKELIPDMRKALARAQLNGLPTDAYFPLIYWLVGADYDSTEREFRYLEADFDALHMLRRRVKRINPGMLELIGGTGKTTVIAQIKTKSAKDFRTLRKEAPSGIVGCEASQLDLIVLERLLERTAPSDAWLFLTGTMEGSIGWYPTMGKAWGNAGPDKAWFRLKSSSNYYLFPGGDADPKLLKQREAMTETLYKERFEGEPCLPSGVVFPEFRPDLHVKVVNHEPGRQVQLWEDPGYGTDSPHAILAVQIVDGQVRVVDEIFERGRTTEEIIRDMVKHREWYEDFEVLVDDPHYSTQHHAATSTREVWTKLTGRKAQNKRERVLPRIERIKTFLLPTASGAPKLVINPKCVGLLSEFGMVPNPFDKQEHVYRWRVDRDGNPIGEEPDDRWNDSIDCLGRGLVHNFGHADWTTKPRNKARVTFFNQPRRRRRAR